MYKYKQPNKTTLTLNNSYIGETIEQKVDRIMNNKEPIKDGAPLIYTDRKDGVQPQYDVRTDRWEIATEAMDKVSKDRLAKREARHNPKEETTTDTTENKTTDLPRTEILPRPNQSKDEGKA